MADRRITLRDGRAVEDYLRVIVEAGARDARVQLDDMELAQVSQRERNKQSAMAKNVRNAVGRRKGSKDEVEEQDDDLFADDKGGDDKKKKKDDGDKKKATGLPKHIHTDLPDAEDVTIDMVVDRMNVIRSGKSMKDEKVAVELSHYFEDLSSPERLALLSFLTGLAQIVTGGIEGEKAPDPGDPGIDIKVTPTGEKGGERHPGKPKPSGKTRKPEEIAPPISVGTAQRTESIRHKIRSLL